MNIKQSLQFSNLLMLIIPLVLGILAALCSMFFLTNVVYRDWSENMQKQETFFRQRNVFYQEVLDMLNEKEYSERLSRETKLKIDAFRENTKIQVCADSDVIFKTDNITAADQRLMHTALRITGGGIISIGNTELLSREFSAEGKTITVLILSNTTFRHPGIPGVNKKRRFPTIMLVSVFIAVLVITVLIMNHVMTRFVFSKICQPLESITYGVHQIRDGNLDYVMGCNVPEEFVPVCEDFNSMATRLKTSVESDRNNEQTRKELLAGISHDLRTPLTSISAYIQGLLDNIPKTPQDQRRYMETIQQKSDDIIHMVDKLFLFSKLDLEDFPFYPEPVVLNEALQDFYTQNKEYYSNNSVSFNLKLQNKKTIVYIDPVQLRNALNNIIENSIKYGAQNNCCITVSVMHAVMPNGTPCADIIIEDNGNGVPDDTVDKLFDVFYRADPSRSNPRKGSGLGLAITAKLLKRQNGVVYAENIHDETNNVCGLRVVIKIPLTNHEKVEEL